MSAIQIETIVATVLYLAATVIYWRRLKTIENRVKAARK